MVEMDRSQIITEIDALVEAQRERCLWFLRRDYRPATDADRRRMLAAIKEHGDRVAFQRAAELDRWLSRTSSVESADS